MLAICKNEDIQREEYMITKIYTILKHNLGTVCTSIMFICVNCTFLNCGILEYREE